MRSRAAQAAIAFGFILLAAVPASAQRRGFGGGASGVYKSRIEPHWFDGGARFWYQNDLARGTREFILVDAEKGTRAKAFDHERLAAALERPVPRARRPIGSRWRPSNLERTTTS